MKSDTRKLLDRLYNLRGNDSVVLFDIEQENKAAEETRASAEKEKKELEDSIDRLTKDSTVLEEQGERLKNILDALKEEDFSVIVNRLQLDFNPEEVSDKINRSLPGTIAALASEKKEAEIKLSEVESTMDSAITEIEELNIRRDEAIENQQKLNEFVELALTGNSNLTRDSITSLLAKFKFSKDEQRETAKLLMFPEDGLFEYEQKLAAGEKSGMSISDVFQEAKQEVNEDVQEKVEIIPEEPNRKYIAPDLIESTITPIDVVDDIETVEIKDEIDKEEVKKLLEENGFNVGDFTNQDIKEILDNFDKELISKNINYLVNLGINRGIFVDHVELLYDKELITKVDILMNIGKSSSDIYLNPNVLVKYNVRDLNETISSFKDSGLDPKIVPLMAF